MATLDPPRSAGSTHPAALGVFQALLLGVGAWYLWQRWEPAGVLCSAALLAQLGAAIALLAGASEKWTRWAALLTLAVVALIVGLHLQVGVYVVRSFGLSAEKGWALMGVTVGGGAGASLVPIIQLFVLRGSRLSEKMGVAAALILPLVLPPLYSVSQLKFEHGPRETAGQNSLAQAYESWVGKTVQPTLDDAHALGVLYVLRDGHIASQTQIDGPRTQSLIDALPKHAPGPRDALIFEEVRYLEPLPELAFDGLPPILSPGREGLYGPKGVQGALILWRSPSVRRRPIGGALRAPAVDPELAADATIERPFMGGWPPAKGSPLWSRPGACQSPSAPRACPKRPWTGRKCFIGT